MKRPSNYLKMRVLGALENAPGNTMQARYRAVGEMTFHEELNDHFTRWFEDTYHLLTKVPGKLGSQVTFELIMA